MKAKILFIINESTAKMHLGKNTTLAYMLAALELGYEVYAYDLSENLEILEEKLPENLSVLALNFDEKIVEKFKEKNRQIASLAAAKDLAALAGLENEEVAKYLSKQPQKQLIKRSDFAQIVQRLEPMKKPFPPLGNHNVDEVLQKISAAFPGKNFNAPVGLLDKEIPHKIDEILQEKIATPTASFKLLEENFSAKIFAMKKTYEEIFGEKKSPKVVIKPKESAQSLGVFALEFVSAGANLEKIKNSKISELKATQIYKISGDLASKNLEEIVKILCFVQSPNHQDLTKIIADFSAAEITAVALEIYNYKVLAQPFLEGILQGDVRVIFLKNAQKKFYAATKVFRKNLQDLENNFTTCYSGGMAISLPVQALSEDEQKSLEQKTNKILQVLNNELSQEYRTSMELGADFILLGDSKNLLLGEINHHCPALLPIGEAMDFATNPQTKNYDGGLGLAKKFLTEVF
jgi:hypothetical protein